MKIVGDIETFSRVNLKKAGMARYAEDESTDLNCFCWKVDGLVHAWVPQADPDWVVGFKSFCYAEGHPWQGSIHTGKTWPAVLRTPLENGAEFHAWNAGFERTVINGPAGQRYGKLLQLSIQQMRCSMAKARVHGLPGSLEEAGHAVNAPIKKRLKGSAAMRYLASPRRDGTRPMLSEEPDRFMELVLYCALDVEAEESIDNLVPDMTEQELEIWRIDQEMNTRGVLIDLELVDNMEVLIAEYKRQLEAKCREITGIKPSRPGPLADWIRAHGYPQLENLQADTVRQILRLDLPADVKTVLRIYGTYNAKAVMKYAAMRQAVCSDGRIRYMFMFYGAGTGRWSSTIVQLQNMARPSIEDPDTAIAASAEWDLDWIRTLYPTVDPMKVFGTCVRGALIAAPGNELVFPDFAGVEARFNAWLANESWKLHAYRDYDRGVGDNLYVIVYARCFGLDPRSPEGRAGKQIGKVLDLSMGYEGGVGAYVKMAGGYQIDLKGMAEKAYPTLPRDILEESVEAYHYAKEQGRLYDLEEKVWVTCESLKRLWRRAHPGVVRLWADLKRYAIEAVENPGVAYKVAGGRIMFKVVDRWLVMRLPSGRKTYYFRPRVVVGKKGDKVLHYFGINTVTRKWGPTSTYGGKLCENETQAGCRDLLTRAKVRMRFRGLPLIGSVHDEPILETRIGQVTDEEITKDMCEEQTWDLGLPLAVEVHRGPRYRK